MIILLQQVIYPRAFLVPNFEDFGIFDVIELEIWR
jgi:hypothetical protein